MGVWMIGTGNISIKPRVEENLIKEYINFQKAVFRKSTEKNVSPIHGFLMKIVSCFLLQGNLQSHQSGIVI